MQLFGHNVFFSSSRVLVSSNCKQSITVWFLLSTFYWHCFKAWWDLPIVCRCKTIFPLVGPAKLKNNVSETLIVKIEQLPIVYNYRTLRQVMTMKWRHLRSWYTAFSFYGRILKLDRVKTMGTRGKINAIWWNININLHKLVSKYMWIWTANKLQNFTQKDLTEVKILLKVLGGLLF